MSLFTVNRYQGDEAPNEENEQVANCHLSTLMQRIEERRRKRIETSAKTKEPCKDISESDEKKSEIQTEQIIDRVTEELDSHVQNNETKLVDKKQKKKKIKNKDNENQLKENETTKVESDFAILGSKMKKKLSAVKRVLPDWLAHPEIVSSDLSTGPSLDNLDFPLDPKLIKILKENKIEKLFPVQAKTVSWLLKCNEERQCGWWMKDTCVSAPTGSGKTLSYVLPIVQHLQHRIVPKVRCLIVLPVQELASQVHQVIRRYTAHTKLKVALLSGSSSFQQEQTLLIDKNANNERDKSRVDIVVATPGRLVEHILKTPEFNLNDLQFIVIDEADRSTTDWLQHLPDPHWRKPSFTLSSIRSSEPRPAQKLLFSATLTQDPEKLNHFDLFCPILITSISAHGSDNDTISAHDFAGRYTSPEELLEYAIQCTAEFKPLVLYDLLSQIENLRKVLVFTNSGETAHRLALLTRILFGNESSIIAELSARLTFKQRQNILNDFIEGKIKILISSDALARGLDIPDVRLVVSYDIPKHIKGLIHRAGRTSRAGKEGTSISLLTPNQVGVFKNMLNAIHKEVPVIENLDYESVAEEKNYQDCLKQLQNILESEKAESLEEIKATKRNRKRKITH